MQPETTPPEPHGWFDMLKGSDIESGAEFGLLAIMSGISQDGMCAAWINGLSDELRDPKPGVKIGYVTLTDRQATLLRLLSEEAGGWWEWPSGQLNGPVFVRRDTALEDERSDAAGR